MARPSRHLDAELLNAGEQLYPQWGSAGLSVRRVATAAGVAPGMFHYHFKSKSDFVGTLLQRFYDGFFVQLDAQAHAPGEPLERLAHVLALVARLLRRHGAMLRRVLADADAGEPVVLDFVRRNVPRHATLLLGLADEAERAGQLQSMPPLTRFSFLMGAVVTPVLALSRVQSLGVAPEALAALIDPQVLSDEAIEQRIALALAALRPPGTLPPQAQKTKTTQVATKRKTS
ncbi:TetR/AcrR family transcriptional regulator [Ottowia sp.]|uniref:TetR/AcrR family transcriptional regulator n=1 Tax=Ottowia sp. TaxID=1898956 RepID=UPI003A83A6D7